MGTVAAEANKLVEVRIPIKKIKMVLYSYLHHSLERQSVWIYLLLKQKPSVNALLYPAK